MLHDVDDDVFTVGGVDHCEAALGAYIEGGEKHGDGEITCGECFVSDRVVSRESSGFLESCLHGCDLLILKGGLLVF